MLRSKSLKRSATAITAALTGPVVIDGKIEAKKVILTGTARMTGDVVHSDIKIESGAHIDGHLKPEFGKSGAKPAAVANAPRPLQSVPTGT